jgi:maltooligosyltrehalose trehalohydrolase
MRELGARWHERGTTFRVWAPEHDSVDLVLERAPLAPAIHPLAAEPDGYWSADVADALPGTRYRYRLDGDNAKVFPDPVSRYQPAGVHGPSQVIDPFAFEWRDGGWHPPPLERLVIYELHVGTFSPEGTFAGTTRLLPELARLGVTAIELMPLADFPGERNWGYDGVALFAPARCYGEPDDLRTLVGTAHRLGLAVIVDAVFNHLGPDGAYANAFSAYYFTDRHHTPWGKGINLDGPHSDAVRDFLMANVRMWRDEYHVDGLRLDATHELRDDPSPGSRQARPHFLAELTTTFGAAAPRPMLFIAEDERNLATLVHPTAAGGYGMDAVWADDFHHQIRVHLAGDRESYFAQFSGTGADIAATLRQGWFFTGQPLPASGRPRGTDPAGLDPARFVICVQNHDQVGNRATGERLHHEIPLAEYRAACTLLLLAPHTPLLFMGQEWAASSPFLFFTDHHAALGEQVTRGRRLEFAGFARFAAAGLATIPDPQAIDTFESSRLAWAERDRPPHSGVLELHRRLLSLRASHPALQRTAGDAFDASALDAHTVALTRATADETLLTVVRLSSRGSVRVDSQGGDVLLTTEDSDLTPDPRPIGVTPTHVEFARPGAIVIRLSGRRIAPPGGLE